MQQDQLAKILADHLLWLQRKPNGIRADLGGANLSYADLIGADLSYADLGGVNLRNANLSGVNLRNANLSGADLSYADLSGVNLVGADLSGAVSANFSFLAVYRIGSANLQALYIPEMDIVFHGGFKGTMSQFKEQVASNANGKHLEAYNNAIEYLEKQAVLYRKD